MAKKTEKKGKKKTADFMGNHFLLPNNWARRLYHEYAENMPIFDFHCHLPVEAIAKNGSFASITELWLGGDHYKWRAMRSNGIPEEKITGGASDWEKFSAWAETVPRLIGNPLYHWTHLELRRYFGVEQVLSPATAESVYKECNETIASSKFRIWKILKDMKVKALCTTDDPADSLTIHKEMEQAEVPARVTPAMRPDKGHSFSDLAQWNNWVEDLSRETETDRGPEHDGRAKSGPGDDGRGGAERKAGTPEDFSGFISLLEERCRQFHALGCRLSDHAVEKPVAEKWTVEEVNEIYKKARRREKPSPKEKAQFTTAFLCEYARINRELGWTMQLHIGSVRNINSRMFTRLGPDTGFDAMGDFPIARDLAGFLDVIEKDVIEKNVEREAGLPKMIIYPLNPKDNPVIASIIGAFQRDPVPGKLQLGSAWWFNDHIDGMEYQMRTLANLGLLSRFVGMVTDSRSFLSYPRHEYFRRILCGILGTWIERGEAPADMDLIGGMVKDISYRNAADFFEIPGIT